jgi:hypothetical protein
MGNLLVLLPIFNETLAARIPSILGVVRRARRCINSAARSLPTVCTLSVTMRVFQKSIRQRTLYLSTA